MKRRVKSPESGEIEGAEEGDRHPRSDAAPLQQELADLRRRVVRIETELARQEEAATVALLVKRILAACHDWIVEGQEPVLDKEKVRRDTKPRMAGLALALRGEIARQGLTAGDMDDRLAWPEGRTEQVLTKPSELGVVEARLLSRELGTSSERMLGMNDLIQS